MFACLCLVCTTLLPVHANQAVTLRVEKTNTPNDLQLQLVGLSEVTAVSLNLKVNGDAEFSPFFTLSKELESKGARADILQSSKDILDVYITSKQVLSTKDVLVLGNIRMVGKEKASYKIEINSAKTGIKSVSATFTSKIIAADSKNLVLVGNNQSIVDPNKPVPDIPGAEKPNIPSDPSLPPMANNMITDGNAQLGGNDQITSNMKLQVTEVADKEYLQMVRTSLEKLSNKFKAYKVNVTLDGKPITLTKETMLHLPIPTGFDVSKIKVFSINRQNRSELAFRIEGNSVVFNITHLGNYVIAEMNVKGDVTTGDTTQSSLYLGIASVSFLVIVFAIGMVLRKKRFLN